MFNGTIVELLRSTEESYFNNLDTSKINYNRSFWKTIVPLLFFFLKKKQAKKLTWLKKLKMSQTMLNCVVFSIYNYFSEINSNLKIPSPINYSAGDSNAISNPLPIVTRTHFTGEL